ncbi:hypothetical protein SERLA73DRAFT_186548, partial [Serpula lacrymans var. lacrymans S7.3]
MLEKLIRQIMYRHFNQCIASLGARVGIEDKVTLVTFHVPPIGPSNILETYPPYLLPSMIPYGTNTPVPAGYDSHA